MFFKKIFRGIKAFVFAPRLWYVNLFVMMICAFLSIQRMGHIEWIVITVPMLLWYYLCQGKELEESVYRGKSRSKSNLSKTMLGLAIWPCFVILWVLNIIGLLDGADLRYALRIHWCPMISATICNLGILYRWKNLRVESDNRQIQIL